MGTFTGGSVTDETFISRFQRHVQVWALIPFYWEVFELRNMWPNLVWKDKLGWFLWLGICLYSAVLSGVPSTAACKGRELQIQPIESWLFFFLSVLMEAETVLLLNTPLILMFLYQILLKLTLQLEICAELRQSSLTCKKFHRQAASEMNLQVLTQY